jgi:hypothetical protein
MKGQILGFDGATGAITGADGERYSFALADWKGEQPPKPRDAVDFVGKDGVASEIYPTQSSLGAAFSGLGAGAKGTGGGGEGLKMVAGRPQVVLEALAILVALLFPYISTFILSVTIVGLPSLINQAAAYGGGVGGGVGALALLAYLLWLIPIGGALALYLDFTGKRDVRVELALGALCIFATVYYFLLSSAVGAASTVFSLGFGGYVILLVGVGLILTGLGRITRVPGL